MHNLSNASAVTFSASWAKSSTKYEQRLWDTVLHMQGGLPGTVWCYSRVTQHNPVMNSGDTSLYYYEAIMVKVYTAFCLCTNTS